MKIKISDNCVLCGVCEAISPEVFSVDTKVKINFNNIEGKEKDCVDAALICPMNAIWIDDIF